MLSNDATRTNTPAFAAVVPGLSVLRDVFVNLYYAFPEDQPQGPWVLIDAGLPGSAGKIKKHAEYLFGATPPVAILLTHGHFDHVGALHGLLEAWPDVPVYAHPLELPYLTGRSAYPPPDPTVGGGLMAYSSFLYPKQPHDFGARVEALPADSTVPGLPGWRWVPTPGHTFGHVSFFRQHDRVVVAGDAMTTVRGESGRATLSQKQEVHGPPAYFTPDWDAARASVELLARLQPEVAATGHGISMHGETLRRQLTDFAARFDALARPKVGRYAQQPATADASGVRSVPAPLVQPWVKGLAVAGLALGLVALATRNGRNRQVLKGLLAAGRQRNNRQGPYEGSQRHNPTAYQPHARHRDVGAQPGDHRYTDQHSQRIETQYP